MARAWRHRVVVGVFLVALIAASGRMFSLEGETRRLGQAYGQAKEELTRLEEELLEARTRSEAAQGELASVRQEVAQLQSRLDEASAALALSRHASEALRQEHVSLGERLERIMAEKQELEAKFASIKELKLAIRAVRRTMRGQQLAVWRAQIAAQQVEDQQQLAEGNRGYVVRERQSTLGARARLHVRVLEPQSP